MKFDFAAGNNIIKNVNCLFLKVLLPAANLLLIQEVKEACYDFLKKQLRPTNCLGINALFDSRSSAELITSSELYIQQHFSYEILFNIV